MSELTIDIVAGIIRFMIAGLFAWGTFKIKRHGRLLDEHIAKLESLDWVKGLHYDDIDDLFQTQRELEKKITTLENIVRYLSPTKKGKKSNG